MLLLFSSVAIPPIEADLTETVTSTDSSSSVRVHNTSISESVTSTETILSAPPIEVTVDDTGYVNTLTTVSNGFDRFIASNDTGFVRSVAIGITGDGRKVKKITLGLSLEDFRPNNGGMQAAIWAKRSGTLGVDALPTQNETILLATADTTILLADIPTDHVVRAYEFHFYDGYILEQGIDYFVGLHTNVLDTVNGSHLFINTMDGPGPSGTQTCSIGIDDADWTIHTTKHLSIKIDADNASDAYSAPLQTASIEESTLSLIFDPDTQAVDEPDAGQEILGDGSASSFAKRTAQSFIVNEDTTLNRITTKLAKAGTPNAANIYIEILAANLGSGFIDLTKYLPVGESLGTSLNSVPTSALTDHGGVGGPGYQFFDYYFDDIPLKAGHRYAAVFYIDADMTDLLNAPMVRSYADVSGSGVQTEHASDYDTGAAPGVWSYSNSETLYIKVWTGGAYTSIKNGLGDLWESPDINAVDTLSPHRIQNAIPLGDPLDVQATQVAINIAVSALTESATASHVQSALVTYAAQIQETATADELNAFPVIHQGDIQETVSSSEILIYSLTPVITLGVPTPVTSANEGGFVAGTVTVNPVGSSTGVVEGDAEIMVITGRLNSYVFTPVEAGWTRLYRGTGTSFSTIEVYVRPIGAGDTRYLNTETVNYSSGNVGQTIIAARFVMTMPSGREIFFRDSGTFFESNDTDVGPIQPPSQVVDSDLILSIGYNTDDWTGAIPNVSGWTEIVETSSSLGNDAALVISYRVGTHSATPAITYAPANYFAGTQNMGVMLSFGVVYSEEIVHFIEETVTANHTQTAIKIQSAAVVETAVPTGSSDAAFVMLAVESVTATDSTNGIVAQVGALTETATAAQTSTAVIIAAVDVAETLIVAGSTPTKTGSTLTFGIDGANPSGQSISVPADAELALFFFSGYNAIAFNLVGVTLGGQAFTVAASQDSVDAGDLSGHGVAYLVNPPTGTQTLDWEWTVNPVEGPVVFVHFVKDVDTGNPIRDVGLSRNTSSSAVAPVVIDSSEEDYVVALTESYNTNPDGAPSGSGQTVDTNGYNFSSRWGDLVVETSPGATSTTISMGTNSYSNITAISIRGSQGSAGASDIPDATVLEASEQTVETLTATETQAALATFVASRTEANTAIESQSTVAIFNVSESESVTSTETQTSVLVAPVTLTESATVIDTPTSTANTFVVVSETVTATESHDADQDGLLSADINESLTAVDVNSVQTDFVSSQAESLSAVETQTGTSVLPILQTETVSANDNTSQVTTLPVQISEINIAIEQTVGTNIALALISDSATADDSTDADQTGVFSGTVDESATASESLTSILNAVANDTESVTAIETISGVSNLLASNVEAGIATDIQDRTITVIRDLTETVTSLDTLSAVYTGPVQWTESVTATEEQVFARITNAALTESVTATETQSSQASIDRSISESLTSSDVQVLEHIHAGVIEETLVAVETVNPDLTTTVALIEAISAEEVIDFDGSLAAILTESAFPQDELGVIATNFVSQIDSTTAIEQSNSTLTFTLSQSESISAQDTTNAGRVLPVSISETVNASESISYPFEAYNVNLTETTVAVTAETAIANLIASKVETLTALEIISGQSIADSSYIESTVAEDTFLSIENSTVTVIDQAVASEINEATIIRGNEVGEIVTAGDTLSVAIIALASVTETNTAIDTPVGAAIYPANITSVVNAIEDITGGKAAVILNALVNSSTSFNSNILTQIKFASVLSANAIYNGTLNSAIRLLGSLVSQTNLTSDLFIPKALISSLVSSTNFVPPILKTQILLEADLIDTISLNAPLSTEIGLLANMFGVTTFVSDLFIGKGVFSIIRSSSTFNATTLNTQVLLNALAVGLSKQISFLTTEIRVSASLVSGTITAQDLTTNILLNGNLASQSLTDFDTLQTEIRAAALLQSLSSIDMELTTKVPLFSSSSSLSSILRSRLGDLVIAESYKIYKANDKFKVRRESLQDRTKKRSGK